MIAGFVAVITSVIGAMAVFNRQTNRRFDDVNRRFDDVDKRFDDTNRRIDDTNRRIDDTNRRIDDLKNDIASVREELYNLTLHLIPRPPARKQENVYETATEQSVVREKPKE